MKTSASKKEAPQCNKAKGGATDSANCATTVQAVKWLACCTGASCGKIHSKAKALGLKNPVRQNTSDTAVCTPTDKRGFVSPKFSGMASTVLAWLRGGMGLRYSKDCAQSVRMPAWLYPCFEHPAHPLRFKTQKVASQSHTGAKTMHQVNLLARNTAPTPKASPAIIPPTTNNTSEVQAFALLEATSAAALAGFYLRRGDVKAARRKAVLLLKSLQVLEVAHA